MRGNNISKKEKISFRCINCGLWFPGKPNRIGLCDLCKTALENDKKMIINKCPTCNRDLEEILDKDGFLIDRWCSKCGIHLSIFDLEVEKEKKEVNLDKWIKK